MVFSNTKNEKDRLTTFTAEFKEKSHNFGTFLRRYYFVYGLSIVFYIGLIFIIMGYLSIQGTITAGDFALIFMINYKIADKLSDIAYKLIEFTQQIAIASNAIKLLDFDMQQDCENKFTYKEGKIVFNNMNFAYNGNIRLFNNFNLTIASKQNIGLVGFSGSGKLLLLAY